VESFGRSRIISRGWLSLVLLAALFLMLLKAMSRRKKMTTINETGKTVYLLLIEWGFNPHLAQYITAQAAHETANFTSKVFLQNNNLFGYKYVRQAIALGEKNGHAYYANITNSIQDFKRYFTIRGYPRYFATVTDYVQALKNNGYFEAPIEEYIKGVQFFHNLYFNGSK